MSTAAENSFSNGDPSGAAAISFVHLTKRFKNQLAVNDLTVDIAPSRITGLIGPNGAGKSTALRCLLGLATPTSGETRILGSHYSQLTNPMSRIGAVLDSRSFNPGLTARQNLLVLTAAAGIDDKRVAEVLAQVDLAEAANKRVKGFSLGMKQRLSLAGALLANPEVLILDEPANGLDPIGIAWLRGFLRELAVAGRTILVSSHQLAELEHTIDDVIILHKGTLIAAGTKAEITQGRSLEDAFLALTLAAETASRPSANDANLGGTK
jgi:ABC-2 type transport system ATP-binding protein